MTLNQLDTDRDGLDEELDQEDLEDEYEDDGQPTEYEEWQDYMGGDDNFHDWVD